MSTSHGPPSRTRLALALTAAAAAAAPAAATAMPVAKAGTRSDVAPASGQGQLATPPTRPAPAPEARATVDTTRSRPGPVIVAYAVRPAAYTAPAPSAAPAPSYVDAVDDDLFYDEAAAAAEVELVRLTRVSGGARLAVVADEPGTLHVSWTAGSTTGSTKQQLRAGRHELRLQTPRKATHVRVHATLHPSSGSVSASTHAAFRLRT